MYAASSVCEAKQKMPEDIFLKINKDLVLKYEEGVKEGLLLGKHRIFAVDGTRLNLPREMVDCGYKKCNKDAYYPQGLMSCIYDINTHIVHDFCLEKNLNERICAAEHIKVLKKDDVVIFDRGYFSYLMLCQCMELRVHPIFRISLSLANQPLSTGSRKFEDKDWKSISVLKHYSILILEVAGGGLPSSWLSIYSLIISSVTLPLVLLKYPLAHKCFP